MARSIPEPDRHVQALVAVAGALAQALSAMASALAARGDTRQARHVASVACAVGRWTMALVPVLSLEPSAVRVLTGP